jgi:hypothetical protein
VATPCPAAPPIPIAKVCFITPSLTECRPVHEALALGRAQITLCILCEGLLVRWSSWDFWVAGVYTRFLDVVVVQEIGSGSVFDLRVYRDSNCRRTPEFLFSLSEPLEIVRIATAIV